MKHVMPITLLIFCFTLFSCSKEKKDAKDLANCQIDNIVSFDIQQELAAISAAAQAYDDDESTANCNNYKNAWRNYIDAIDEILDCARIFDLEKIWEDAIQDAEDEIASIC